MVEARCPGNLDEPEIYGPAGVEPSAARGGTARCRGRAAGYQTRMRWNDPSDWVWSTEQTHEAIVSSEDFSRAQAQMAAGAHRPFTAKGHRTKRTYMLRGLVSCGLCTRKMQGSYNHDARARAGPTPGTTHETADPRARIEPRRHRIGAGNGRPEIEGRGLRRAWDLHDVRPRDQDGCCRITTRRRV
jgi:hypothetical protein